MSDNIMNAPPTINPRDVSKYLGRFNCSNKEIAGAKSDQKEAAIITPAANPIIMSRIFLLNDLKKNTNDDPNIVTR